MPTTTKHGPGICWHYQLYQGHAIMVDHDDWYDYCTADDQEEDS